MSKFITSIWICLLMLAASSAVAQQVMTASSDHTGIMIVATSRNQYMFVGGIGPAQRTARGTIAAEPVARLTASGEWLSLPCGASLWENAISPKAGCKKFEREYLSKPHTLSVVTSDGYGAKIHTAPVSLSECYDYSGTGTYSGTSIQQFAIAASSPEFFVVTSPPQPLRDVDTKPILNAVAARIPGGLRSSLYFKFLSLRLEGQALILVQRSFAEFPSPKTGSLQYIFAVGTMKHGQFHILQWKQNIENENEHFIGTIRLKNGCEFLITSVNDPEAQWFRVYGIRKSKLVMVYSGGGASC